MGIGRNVGFMFIVDECTDRVFIEFLRSKSEVGVKLKYFQRRPEYHFQQKLGKYMVPHTLSCVRSDNAMENICTEVHEGFDVDGIHHELSSVYCQWEDGKCHFIRIYWEGGEAMHKTTGAPACYWPFSLRVINLVYDLMPRRTKESPWEGWNGVTVPYFRRMEDLRVWDTRCFFLVPKELRKKFDDKAREWLFVGYSSTSKVYVGIERVTGRILMSPNVMFDETCYPRKDKGFTLPPVCVVVNLGNNMTELSWVLDSGVHVPSLVPPPPSHLLPSPVLSSQAVTGSPHPGVSPPLVTIDVLEEDVVVLDEEDVVVLGEGSTSVTSRLSSRRVRAPKTRVVDEGYDVSVHYVESPSLVHLDDPDPVLVGTSEVSLLLAKVQTARAAVRTVLGGPFQHASPLGFPILSHSVSKTMVLGRLLGLDDVDPEPSPAKAGTAGKLQTFSGLLSEADALFMTTVPYVETVSSLFNICRANRWDTSFACS
jgi:hypothetical protein